MKVPSSFFFKKFLACILFSGICLTGKSQLNSVDAYGGPHKILNPAYPTPAQALGWTYGARYNLDFSWEWAALFSAGIDKTSYAIATGKDVTNNNLTVLSKNTYVDFGVGIEWQWMTEIRTRMGGGKTSCRGSKAIIMAPFKSYFMGGLNYKMLIKSSDTYAGKSVLNWYAGMGFEWCRLGANASHGNNAFVPFTEFIYNSNMTNNPYSIDGLGNKISLTSVYVRFGVKYTFGFPEKKFAWGGKK
jgi:hypothetical protein